MNYILIDGSYFIFYRYYALMMWWKHVNKDNELGEPHENTIFNEKFKTTFSTKINEFIRKLKIDNPIILVGKDCPRNEIWRKELYPEYKDNREHKHQHIGDMFKMTYQEELFEKAGAKKVLNYNSLEADDCLALTTKYILEKNPESHIWIITSDMDYLQLASDKVSLFDLKLKDLTKSKNCTGISECDKFCKIICGDKSDNIKPVIKRCGMKTAIKYFNNKELFERKIEENKLQEQYNLNKTLIDFNEIPSNLVEGFYSKYSIVLYEYLLL